jgi:hypothetical protein
MLDESHVYITSLSLDFNQNKHLLWVFTKESVVIVSSEYHIVPVNHKFELK